MRGYTESDIEDLQEAIAELEAKNSSSAVKMETLRKQRADLLAACEAQQKAILDILEEISQWEMLGALDYHLHEDALRLGNCALAKAKEDQC